MARTVSQIRACATALQQVAKEQEIALFLIGHVTKEGAIAGPKVLEHLVDVVLYFEGDPQGLFRVLRATKNRAGSGRSRARRGAEPAHARTGRGIAVRLSVHTAQLVADCLAQREAALEPFGDELMPRH